MPPVAPLLMLPLWASPRECPGSDNAAPDRARYLPWLRCRRCFFYPHHGFAPDLPTLPRAEQDVPRGPVADAASRGPTMGLPRGEKDVPRDHTTDAASSGLTIGLPQVEQDGPCVPSYRSFPGLSKMLPVAPLLILPLLASPKEFPGSENAASDRARHLP